MILMMTSVLTVISNTISKLLSDFQCSSILPKDEKGHSPVRNTANARERARMRVLSSAFYRLKTIIPWVPHDTKLSKLDTLRLARNYIAYLTSTLDGEPVEEISNKMPHPQKMVSDITLIIFNSISLNRKQREGNICIYFPGGFSHKIRLNFSSVLKNI